MKTHYLRNKILSLTSANGMRLTDPDDIKNEILGYYLGLLGSPFAHSRSAYQSLRVVVSQRLSVTMKSSLVQRVSKEEIKTAMWAIKGGKAPGPDGLCSNFFHKNWDIVGEDVVQAIQLFFDTGIMPRQWNCTALTLAPKVDSPASIKDFRPIACYNVVYKCATKILANRLQLILPLIISPSQSAFIKGRSIMDNILLMQELVKNYHKDEGLGALSKWTL